MKQHFIAGRWTPGTGGYHISATMDYWQGVDD